jgi:hypothetical protein
VHTGIAPAPDAAGAARTRVRYRLRLATHLSSARTGSAQCTVDSPRMHAGIPIRWVIDPMGHRSDGSSIGHRSPMMAALMFLTPNSDITRRPVRSTRYGEARELGYLARTADIAGLTTLPRSPGRRSRIAARGSRSLARLTAECDLAKCEMGTRIGTHRYGRPPRVCAALEHPCFHPPSRLE